MGFQEVHTAVLFLIGPLTALTALSLCVLENSASSLGSKQELRSPADASKYLFLGALVGPATGFLTLRAHEGAVLGGALVLSPTVVAWLLVFLFCAFISLGCKTLFTVNQSSRNFAETLPALGGLNFCWLLALTTRSFFGYVLLLELAGLCLIYLLITTKGFKSDAAKFEAFQGALTFLWVSIFSLFAMLWAFYYSLTK